MPDLAAIIEIVRSQEAEEVKNAVVLTVLMVAVGIPCAVYLVRNFAKQGVMMCLIFVGALVLMATKQTPQVIWDDYLVNNGTVYATNSVGTKTGVDFKWRKTNAQMPSSTPVYISKSPTNETSYVIAATTTAGALLYGLTLSTPDGYKYWVWHEWVPPSPVHTNGVWLGNVLEKAKGTVGTDKMIIINGQMLENGKEIAPCLK